MHPPVPTQVTDWTAFKLYMGNIYHSACGPSIKSIDAAIQNLTITITIGIKLNSFPYTLSEGSRVLPKKLQFKINFKHHLRCCWQRTRDPDIKMSLNNQITKVKNLMSEYCNNQWNNFLGSLEDGSRHMYVL